MVRHRLTGNLPLTPFGEHASGLDCNRLCEVAMAVLKFVCPTSGNLVDTGLDMDARSFAGLPRERTELSCPHCPDPHLLATVQAWLGELQPEYE